MNPLNTLALRGLVGLQTTALAGTAKSKQLVSSPLEGPFARMQVLTGAMLTWLLMGSGVAFAQASKTGDSQDGVVSIINTAATWLILLIGAASVLMFAWASFLFVTSAGNSKAIEMAKTTAKNVVIGIALAASIYLIKGLIINVLDGAGGASKNDSGTRETLVKPQ